MFIFEDCLPLLMGVPHWKSNIGIQMKLKELSKIFMMISNQKNPFVSWVYRDISAI